MKILIVHPHIFGGGAEHQVLYLANYLQRRHHVSIVTLSIEENIPEFGKGLDFILPKKPELSPLSNQMNPSYFYFANAVLKLRSLVKSVISNYDLLNPHNFPAPFSCMRQSNKRAVWFSQGDSPGFFGDMFRVKQNIFSSALTRCLMYIEKLLVRKYIDQICTVSRLASRIIEKRYEKPTEVVYPGVNYKFYSEGNAQKARNKYLLDGSFIILYVARINSQKNQMAAVLALEKLIQTIPNIKLVFAGAGENPYALRLKRYIKLKQLERYVTFTGYINSEDVRDLYHACNVNIFPATNESFGLTPIEGLCASKIPVVNPTCGVADILLQHNIGIISDDLASSLRDIHENYALYKAMASRGKELVKDLLSMEAFGRGLETVFLKHEQK